MDIRVDIYPQNASEIVQMIIVKPEPWHLQLSKSSLIKQGGAYFSAISGWKSILMSAPEAYEHRECCGLLVLSLTLTLFTTSTKHHGSCWGGWSLGQISHCCSQGFVIREQILVNKSEKSDHPPQQEPWCFVEVVNKVSVRDKTSSPQHSRCSYASGALIRIYFHPETAEK